MLGRGVLEVGAGGAGHVFYLKHPFREYILTDLNKEMLTHTQTKKFVFLTTPNRWHPLELHTALLLLHWLPKSCHRRILSALGFSQLSRPEKLSGTIRKLATETTVVIIAHRLTTVENCDRLIWLDDRRVMAEGPPAEILPIYRAVMEGKGPELR